MMPRDGCAWPFSDRRYDRFHDRLVTGGLGEVRVAHDHTGRLPWRRVVTLHGARLYNIRLLRRALNFRGGPMLELQDHLAVRREQARVARARRLRRDPYPEDDGGTP
jgi:hypothetical protein